MRNWFIGVLIALTALAGVGFYFRGPIALAMFERAAPRLMAADRIAQLPDGLHVALCGTGSPLPDPNRSGPCTAIIAGGQVFIVDAGDGSARTSARMGLAPARIAGVFLTHFHSDHIDGLGAIALQHWAGGSAAAPLQLIGPTGVERIAAGFNEAYALDSGYRIAHHGPAVVPPSGFGLSARPFAFAEGAQSATVYDQDGLRVTAFVVNHAPAAPAVGYRFDYKGRSVVVSGDCAPSPVLEAAAKGADVLVHEALAPNLVAVLEKSARTAKRENLAHIFQDIPESHTSPKDAAALATRAGVKALVFTHIVPALPTRALEPAFLNGAQFGGPMWIGADGDLVSLPADGGPMTRSSLLR
jgi:ribonuclease Z